MQPFSDFYSSAQLWCIWLSSVPMVSYFLFFLLPLCLILFAITDHPNFQYLAFKLILLLCLWLINPATTFEAFVTFTTMCEYYNTRGPTIFHLSEVSDLLEYCFASLSESNKGLGPNHIQVNSSLNNYNFELHAKPSLALRRQERELQPGEQAGCALGGGQGVEARNSL